MITRGSLFIVIILCVSCIGGVSSKESISDEFFQERRKSLDIVDLLDALTRKNFDSTSGDWSFVTNFKQIDWEQEGIETNKSKRFLNTTYSRNGTIFITMDNQFVPFVLKKRREPVAWSITLEGAVHWYDYITLTNNVITREFGGFEEYFKKKKLILQVDTLKSQYAVFNNLKLKLQVYKRAITVFQVTEEAGTSGYRVSLYLNSNGSDRPLLEKFQNKLF